MIKSVYLAGKMTGEPEHGFPLFNATAAKLRAQGITVFNPAENAGDGDVDADLEGVKGRRAGFIRKDIFAIVGNGWAAPTVDAVVVLPNWYLSRGARLEVEVAQQCDIPVLWADTLTPVTDAEIEFAREHKCEYYLYSNYHGVAA